MQKKKGKINIPQKTGKHFYNLSITESFSNHENSETIKWKYVNLTAKDIQFLKGRKDKQI